MDDSSALTAMRSASKYSGRVVAVRAPIRSRDYFILSVDRDGFASGQVGQIDAVPLSLKADVECLMAQPDALKPGTNAHRVQ